MKCGWCGEALRFERGRGWVHGNGKVYKTRVDADGIERDDHVAFPVPDKEEEVTRMTPVDDDPRPAMGAI